MPETIKAPANLDTMFDEAKARGEGFVVVDGQTIVRAPYGGRRLLCLIGKRNWPTSSRS